jgi:hypothetical protein
MSAARFEYFATEADHERFFSKIDEAFGLKVAETQFDKTVGPRVFEGFIGFLDFIRRDADPVEKQCIYYGCVDPQSLQPMDNIYSDHLASFDLILNPDVLTLSYGEQIDQKRLLISQIARSHEATEAKKLLSRIKRLAKALDDDARSTKTWEFVFPGALSFLNDGGRLVRTPEAPPLYDAQIAG